MSQPLGGEQTWIDAAADQFERDWKSGPDRPRIEDCLDEADEGRRASLIEELVRVECELRRAAGEQPAPEEYLIRFPDDCQAVNAAFGVDASPRPTQPRVSAAESLLFGLLALQNRFIDRNGLVAAFDAWVSDKTRPLGQILLDRGTLSPARYAALELLVQEHIQQHGCDPERSLAELRVVPEVRDRLEQVADLDFQCSLLTIGHRGGGDTEPDHETTLDWAEESEAADPDGRFQIVRFHDRGNLGEVYLARDSQLHRIVALKRIQRKPAADQGQRAQFVVEAEITGRLEHPGIVPVYSLGTFDDGRPFYAMRFIKGDNLKRAIDQFHQAEQAGRDAGARTLALQKLLRRFLDVCNAIAYAHSRGVVHRDLKPGNIMLGQYGETLVVDWGLAKSVGRPDPVPASATLDDRTLVPQSGSDLHQTAQGILKGTPAYMSPEQAAGRIKDLGPASDVYSLGATLYCLLTGRAPFDDRVLAELLRKVERGEFVPPRQVQGWVDPALEAICLKAMKTDPAQRYANPRALADDVEHWLADEPVGAYDEPVKVRAKRWMRKHPSRVTAVAVLLLTTVVGLTIGGLLLDRSRRLLKQSNLYLAQQTQRADANAAEAERQRQVADEMFHEAKTTVDTYLTKVSEEKLLEEEGLQPLRKELLSLALKYYLGFIKDRVDYPNVRKELANAYTRAGQIYREIYTDPKDNMGSKRGKELSLRGVALYEELVREKPADRELRFALAGGLKSLMLIYWVDGEYEAGMDASSREIPLWEQLRAEDPSNVNFARMLGDSYSWRALVKRDMGDREGQDADIRRAVGVFQEILRNAPDDKATLAELAAAYRRSTRLEDLLEAVWISRQLAMSGIPITPANAPGSAPGKVSFDRGFMRIAPLLPERAVLAWEFNHLTNALNNAAYKFISDLGQLGKAEPLLQECVELGRERMRQSPKSNHTVFEFVNYVGNLGETHFLQGKTQPAVRDLKETISCMEELKRRNFSQGTQDDPSWYRYILGYLDCETGDLTGGLARCDSALREEEELIAQNKVQGEENATYVAHRLTIRESIAGFRFLAGKSSREERLAQQRQILADRKSLHEREPKVLQYERELGASAAVLAGLLLETGHADEAMAVVEDVLPSLGKLVEDDKRDSSMPPQIDSRNYFLRQVWAELLARKGEVLARTGKAADASKAIRQAIEITEDLCKQEPCYLDDLAHHLTLASTLPAKEGLPNAADRAIKALGEYIASGFDNPYKLRHDPRLEPLRKRDDFQKLVKDLEVNVKIEGKR